MALPRSFSYQGAFNPVRVPAQAAIFVWGQEQIKGPPPAARALPPLQQPYPVIGPIPAPLPFLWGAETIGGPALRAPRLIPGGAPYAVIPPAPRPQGFATIAAPLIARRALPALPASPYPVIVPPAAAPVVLWGYQTVSSSSFFPRPAPAAFNAAPILPPAPAPPPPPIFLGGGPAHRIGDEPDLYPLSLWRPWWYRAPDWERSPVPEEELPEEAEEALDEAVEALLQGQLTALQDEITALKAVEQYQRQYTAALKQYNDVGRKKAEAAWRAQLMKRLRKEADEELLLLAAEFFF